MKFDGRAFAQKIEEEVRLQVAAMKSKPKVVSILVGSDHASEQYTKWKKLAAERVGIHFEIVRLPEGSTKEQIVNAIQTKGEDRQVDGIMVQLPIPDLDRKEQNDIINTIPIDKDIDGLRWRESGVMPATVRAVILVMEEIKVDSQANIVVVGSQGSVGEPLVHFLHEAGYTKIDAFDKEETDPARRLLAGEVVISCVGKPGLITGAMVRPGLIAIDVGISQVEGRVSGDMAKDVYNAASVSVEVPGGIGPVTIACLMANVVEINDKLYRKSGTVSKG